ncbi:MAG: hypothetical protein U1E45_23075 [Geminicoccaceae bacterium]
MSLPARRALVDIAWVGGPKLANGLCTVLFSLWLIQVLEPGAFGLFSLAVTLLTFCDAVIGGPLDLAALRLAQLRRGSGTVAAQVAALLTKLAVATIAAGLAFAMAGAGVGPLAEFASRPGALAATAVALLGLLTLRSLLLRLQLSGRFRAYGAVDLAHTTLRYGAGATVVLLAHATPSALLACFAAAPLVLVAGTAPRLGLGSTDRALPRGQDLIDLGHMAGWLLLTTCLGLLIAKLDVLSLATSASLDQLGIYAAGQLIASVPELLGAYVAVVTTPMLDRWARARRLGSSFRSLQLVLLAGAVAGCLVGLLLLRLVGDVLLPSDYARAIPVTLILLPGAAGAFAAVPIALPLVLFLRRRLLFGIDLLLLPVILAAYLLVVPRFGVPGAAAVACGTTLLRSGIVIAAAWRLAVWDGSDERFLDTDRAGPDGA